MNREKKERLKHHTQAEIDAIDAQFSKQHKEDVQNYPELFDFVYDSLVEIEDRRKGISPMGKEVREKIRQRLINGEYPQH
jgi:hypothetical protein